MEMSQLRTFVAVAEEAHLTRAAERLFTSQPAVSAQLKSLEEELRVSLFDRTPKGMQLTPAGTELLDKARMILQNTQDLLSAAHSLEGTLQGDIKVGTNSDAEFLKLPALLSHCRETMPGVSLHLIQGMSWNIIQDVRKGILDSGYFYGPCQAADVHVTTLKQAPLALIAPASWSERFEHASIDELAAMRWVYTTKRCPFYLITDQLFTGQGLEVKHQLFVDSEDTIRALVKSESGIALLRQDDADRAIAEGWGCQWQGELPKVALNLAIAKRRVSEPIMQAWLSQHRKIWPEMSALEAPMTLEKRA